MLLNARVEHADLAPAVKFIHAGVVHSLCYLRGKVAAVMKGCFHPRSQEPPV